MCGLLLAFLRAQFDAQINEMSSATAHATRLIPRSRGGLCR
jgi:hypothetical protein